jgi:hypothetical protein
MGVDDYMDREAGAIAAATAAAVSPRARELLRRGAVYGLAGLMKAGDVAVAAARGAVKGAKDGAAGTSQTSTSSASRPRQTRRSTGSGKAGSGSGTTRSSRSGSSRSTQSRSRRRGSSSASKS